MIATCFDYKFKMKVRWYMYMYVVYTTIDCALKALHTVGPQLG